MSASILTLLKVLNDEDKQAWERTQAGRTLMAKIQKRIAEIDKAEQERVRRQVAAKADAFVKRYGNHGEA